MFLILKRVGRGLHLLLFLWELGRAQLVLVGSTESGQPWLCDLGPETTTAQSLSLCVITMSPRDSYSCGVGT